MELELDVEPNVDLQGDVGGDGRKVKESFGNVEAKHIDFNEYGSKTRVDQERRGNPGWITQRIVDAQVARFESL